MAFLELEPIGDGSHPDLALFATLRRRKDLQRAARFVAEGGKIVLRLLESPFPVESLLLTQDWLTRVSPLLDARTDRIRVFVAERREDVDRVMGFADRQGIKALGRIPRQVTLEDVLRSSPAPRLFAAFDGISNAENMGVLVRNAAGLGVQALVVGETSCSPFLTRAIGTSMGAAFLLPAVEQVPLLEALRRLKAEGVRCIAAHPPAAGTALPDLDLTGDCCFVFGSEGFGISPEVLAACDEAACVPMGQDVDSLNVGSAGAVFFYEAWRQRAAAGR